MIGRAVGITGSSTNDNVVKPMNGKTQNLIITTDGATHSFHGSLTSTMINLKMYSQI